MWDAIIIGAGVTGCSVARELARHQLRVLVLEKSPDVCAATSKGNSAMVHGGFDPTPGTLKAKFNVLGNRMFDQLCSELAVPFQRNGTMIIATSEADMGEIRHLEDMARQNGVPVSVLTGRALRDRFPEIGDEVVGALNCESGGIVCPYGLVIAMAENAALNGVEFKLETRADAVERGGGGWKISTNNGDFETKLVFNCAGTHADKFNNMVSPDKFTITPRYGSHIMMDREFSQYVDTTITQTPKKLPGGGHTKGQGIMPSADGTVILGCDAEDCTDPDDASTTARSLNRILDYFEENWKHLPIARHVPKFPRDGCITAYGGLRAHGDRDDFIIGEAVGAPGFFNAAGIESPGLTAAPAIGVHLAALAVDRLKPAAKADFVVGRDAIKSFREMNDEERAAAVRKDPNYGKIVCRCELVTEAEVRQSIRRPLGAKSVNAVKMRTRAGMGRCQGGFCGPRVVQILAEEWGVDPMDIPQSGKGSPILVGAACSCRFEEDSYE
jgi:Predicted dehydrogenase